MIALLILARRRGVMGSCASGFPTVAAATAAAAIVLALNLLLVLRYVGANAADDLAGSTAVSDDALQCLAAYGRWRVSTEPVAEGSGRRRRLRHNTRLCVAVP